MSIALVKTGTVAIAAAATVTPAFGQATGSGHLLVAGVLENGVDGHSNLQVITTTATGWTHAGSVGTSGSGVTNYSIAIFYKQNCGASETAPAFACTAASNMQAVLVEFSGAAISGVLDTVARDSPRNATTEIDFNWNSGLGFGPIACAGNGELVIDIGLWEGSGSTTATFAAGTYANVIVQPANPAFTNLADSGATKGTLYLTADYAVYGDATGATLQPQGKETISFSKSVSQGSGITGLFKPAAGVTAISSALSPSMALAAGNEEDVALAGDMT